MSKSPFTCNHVRLGKTIAGGARECLDCGHILSNYTLGQLDRAEKAEARVEELEAKVEEFEMFLSQVVHHHWRSDFKDWIRKKSNHGEQR